QDKSYDLEMKVSSASFDAHKLAKGKEIVVKIDEKRVHVFVCKTSNELKELVEKARESRAKAPEPELKLKR
ncbi:hypothetical protein ACFL2A_06665, partial [Thermodesulfobacteriota bacterium]